MKTIPPLDIERRLNCYPVETGTMEGVYEKWELHARGTGRSEELLMNLPTNGECIVVVHNLATGNSMKNRLSFLRPNYPVAKIKFIVITNYEDFNWKLRGYNLPIFIDNGVFYSLTTKLIRKINA